MDLVEGGGTEDSWRALNNRSGGWGRAENTFPEQRYPSSRITAMTGRQALVSPLSREPGITGDTSVKCRGGN